MGLRGAGFGQRKLKARVAQLVVGGKGFCVDVSAVLVVDVVWTGCASVSVWIMC